ncbi:MMPL family transporter [Yinghuangia aomiensis]|uniref:MMPL family transporter n=1 Tax=Yinghuangia aomiensis TaxID=676205 RepID=A0ABP9HUK1_9ACTN
MPNAEAVRGSRNDPDSSRDTGALGRLAGWCYDRRRLVLVLWIAAAVVLTGLSQTVGSKFSESLESGNSQSAQVNDILDTRFPDASGAEARVVVQTPGSFTEAAATTTRMEAALSSLPHVVGVVGPAEAGAGHQMSDDGRTAYLAVRFDTVDASVPTGAIRRVVDTAKSFNTPGYHVAVGGPVIDRVESPQPGPSELVGIVAAMIVMLIAFGSLVAMGLPILTALIGIVIGFAAEAFISHSLTVPDFGSAMLAMVGLGVGIDYALFIVTRYRQGLREGREPRDAVVTAQTTAGRAVLFAGCTVIVSLLGLFAVGLPFMHGLAVGTIAAVALVMGATLTLLPAMLGFAGRAVDRLRIPGLGGSEETAAGRSGAWYRWSRAVQRRPLSAAVLSLLVLGVLIVPLFSMRMAFSDDGSVPTTFTTRQAYDMLTDGFGPGANGPLIVAVELPHGADPAVLDKLDSALARTPGVASATPARINPAGDTAIITVFPNASPQAASTAHLVTTLRDDVIPAQVRGTGLRALVGGETAAGIDVSSYLSGRLPWVVAGVILLAILLLMSVFRSVVLPLKAAVMNLLSVGAAYGVIVAVFQWGWGASLIGVHASGPIDPWIPLMMFTILFGLSMDYEVFLLSRIREEWRRTGDNATAVADGLAGTARVITAAAAIMVCVFGSFVVNDPSRVLKVFGLGLASAILIDATLVRMVLVPSLMELFGDANWYMPRWLDRVMPTLGIERDVDAPTPATAPLDPIPQP